MGRKTVVVVNFDPELVTWLRAQAKTRDRSLSSMIRQFVRHGRRHLDAGNDLLDDIPRSGSAA